MSDNEYDSELGELKRSEYIRIASDFKSEITES